MTVIAVCPHCGEWTPRHDVLCKTNLPIGGRGKPSGAPLYERRMTDEDQPALAPSDAARLALVEVAVVVAVATRAPSPARDDALHG